MARGADLYTRLILDAKEFTQGLEQAKRETLGFGKNLTGAGKAVNALKGIVGKLGVAVGVAGGAYEAFNKTIASSNTLTHEWQGVVEGGKIAVDRFFTSLATGNWSNFVEGMAGAIVQGKELVRVMESLQRFQIGYSLVESQSRATLEQSKRVIEDPNSSKEQKAQAQKDYERAISRLDNYSAELEQRAYDAAKSAYEAKGQTLNASLEELTKFATEIAPGYNAEFNEYKRRLDAVKKQYADKERAERDESPWWLQMVKGANQAEGGRIASKTDGQLQSAIDALNRTYPEMAKWYDIMERISVDEQQQITELMMQAEQAKQTRDGFKNSTLELANKMASQNKPAGGGGVGKALDKVKTPLQEIEERIRSVTQELEVPTDTSDLIALRQLLKSLLNQKSELERAIKIRIDGREVQKLSSADVRLPVTPTMAKLELSKERLKLQGEIDELKKRLDSTVDVDVRARIKGQISDKQSKIDDIGSAGELAIKLPDANGYKSSTDEIASANDALTQSFEGINSIMSTLSQSFDDSAGGALSWAASLVASIGQVITATLPLIAVKKAEATANAEAAATGAASSVASIPFVGPAMAISAVLALIATIAKAPKFATGGVVGGNSFYGDKILARVNSGELILNRQQQATLYNHLAGAGVPQQPSGEVEFKIRGQELVGVLSKYDQRTSRS